MASQVNEDRKKQPKIEKGDIQGIILYAYKQLPSAAYLLFEIEEVALAKAWLGKIADQLTPANQDKKTIYSLAPCLNLSISKAGLEKLGLEDEAINTFPRPFREGIATGHKSRTFGDIDNNGPQAWEWGGANEQEASKNEENIHILLMVYAKDEDALASLKADHISKAEASGLKQVKGLDTEPAMHQSRKEHFGFLDGIGQPYVEGVSKQEDFADNTIRLGEFVLGYYNEYDKFPDAPFLKAEGTASQYLPPKPEKEGYVDLGKNGSFLVFRQLEQHVVKFWEYMQKSAENQTHNGEKDDPIRVASKMMGRWPNGNPMAIFPDDEGEPMKDQNHFSYHHKDLKGFGCPIGSHLRRANPRDAFEEDPEKAIKFVKKNRILRRGRGYGKPLEGALQNEVDKVLNAQEEDKGRGLQFLCFNSHLSRQFELVQAQWLCNPKFLGAYEDVDPVAGHHELFKDAEVGETERFNTFTEPSHQVRKKYYDIPRFITVKGGAYFFTPGIKAIKFLASL